MPPVFLHWRAPSGTQVCLLFECEAHAAQHQKLLEVFSNPPATGFRLEPLDTTLEHWTRLVQAHDVTFAFSDDPGVLRNGHKALSRIRRMALHLPTADVVRIWNAWVDTQIRADDAPNWYWKG